MQKVSSMSITLLILIRYYLTSMSKFSKNWGRLNKICIICTQKFRREKQLLQLERLRENLLHYRELLNHLGHHLHHFQVDQVAHQVVHRVDHREDHQVVQLPN